MDSSRKQNRPLSPQIEKEQSPSQRKQCNTPSTALIKQHSTPLTTRQIKSEISSSENNIHIEQVIGSEKTLYTFLRLRSFDANQHTDQRGGFSIFSQLQIPILNFKGPSLIDILQEKTKPIRRLSDIIPPTDQDDQYRPNKTIPIKRRKTYESSQNNLQPSILNHVMDGIKTPKITQFLNQFNGTSKELKETNYLDEQQDLEQGKTPQNIKQNLIKVDNEITSSSLSRNNKKFQRKLSEKLKQSEKTNFLLTEKSPFNNGAAFQEPNSDSLLKSQQLSFNNASEIAQKDNFSLAINLFEEECREQNNDRNNPEIQQFTLGSMDSFQDLNRITKQQGNEINLLPHTKLQEPSCSFLHQTGGMDYRSRNFTECYQSNEKKQTEIGDSSKILSQEQIIAEGECINNLDKVFYYHCQVTPNFTNNTLIDEQQSNLNPQFLEQVFQNDISAGTFEFNPSTFASTDYFQHENYDNQSLQFKWILNGYQEQKEFVDHIHDKNQDDRQQKVKKPHQKCKKIVLSVQSLPDQFD